MMKKIRLMIITAVLVLGGQQWALAQDRSLGQLKDDISGSATAIKQREDAIKDLEKQIKSHKDAIKDLEKQKKQLESEIKQLHSSREATVAAHDNKLFDDNVSAVLTVPYSKSHVDAALKQFDQMENKDVLKKKDLVKNYGNYTKDLKSFLTKQYVALDKAGWKSHDVSSDLYKDFEKEFKGTKYYKIYNKRAKDMSIPYLDGVMDKVVHFRNSGLAGKSELNEIIKMLND